MIRRRRAGARRLFAIQADEAAAVSFPVQIKTFKVKKGKSSGPKLVRQSKVRQENDNPVGLARQIIIRSAPPVPSVDDV
jgi:hypothetical protein